MSIRTRLAQLEKRHAQLCPPQPEVTEEELLRTIRYCLQIGYLKVEGMKVLSTISHPDLPNYHLCAQLAEGLTRRALERPDAPLCLLLPREAQELLKLLNAGELLLYPWGSPDGSIRRHYLWPDRSCEHNGADELARHLDTALDVWAEQSGQERPTELADIHEWVRELVGEVEEGTVCR